jgi:hypothetical protein
MSPRQRLGLVPLCLLAAVTYAGEPAWAQTGCPITRINDFHTASHLGTIPPGVEVCVAEGVFIEAGERVNVRAEANTPNFSIRLYDQWGNRLTLTNQIGGHPTGNPAKQTFQVPCATWNPTDNTDPPGCDWFDRPPEPK